VSVISGALLTLSSGSKISRGRINAETYRFISSCKTAAKQNTTRSCCFNPAKYQWLIEIAETQASSIGIELLAYQATNVKESAKIHMRLLSNNNSESLAIWLLQDRSIQRWMDQEYGARNY